MFTISFRIHGTQQWFYLFQTVSKHEIDLLSYSLKQANHDFKVEYEPLS